MSAVRNVLAPAPHPEPASCLRRVMRVASFLRNVSRWWRNVSNLSSFIQGRLELGTMARVYHALTLSSRLAARLCK